MSDFGNGGKKRFLESIPIASIEEKTDDLASRCKFNFSYFHVQTAGQDFDGWNHRQLASLLGKLKEYSRQPLDYWRNERVGSGGLKVLSVYGNFPEKSEFECPAHVPHQAQWARFRLESRVRLVGFVLPSTYHNSAQHKGDYFFDKNTFYVVFLDKEHKFYLSGEAN